MGIRLGVDLGTTWTAAAIVGPDGKPQIVRLGSDQDPMPSVVARKGDGLVAGEEAVGIMKTEPTAGVREMKRRLGDATPFIIGGTPFGAEKLMAALLEHVVAACKQQFGDPDEVVLTHPAGWGDFKLDLLRDAARSSGVGEPTLLSEPQAAALFYASLGKVNSGDLVAVYDFGGGTFDAALVRCDAGHGELVGVPDGLERLGGIDLDAAVMAHINSSLGGQLSELDASDPAVRAALQDLRSNVTLAKEKLSSETDVTIPVTAPSIATEVRLTRSEFEDMLRPRLADTIGALERAVHSAGAQMSDLTAILLVGGTSRIPMVAEELGAKTGCSVVSDAHPKFAVASGAALIATGGAAAMDEVKKADEEAVPADSAVVDAASSEAVAPKADEKPAKAAKAAKTDSAAKKKSNDKVAKRAGAGMAAAAGVAVGAAVIGAVRGKDDDAASASATAKNAGAIHDAFDDVAPQPAAHSAGGAVAGAAAAGAAAAGAAPAAPSARRGASADRDDDGPAPAPSRHTATPEQRVQAQTTDDDNSTPAPSPAPTPPVGQPEHDATPQEVAEVKQALLEKLEDRDDVPEDVKQELLETIGRFDAKPGESIGEAADQLAAIIQDRVDEYREDNPVPPGGDDHGSSTSPADPHQPARPDDGITTGDPYEITDDRLAAAKAQILERLENSNLPPEARAEAEQAIRNFQPGADDDMRDIGAQMQNLIRSEVADYAKEHPGGPDEDIVDPDAPDAVQPLHDFLDYWEPSWTEAFNQDDLDHLRGQLHDWLEDNFDGKQGVDMAAVERHIRSSLEDFRQDQYEDYVKEQTAPIQEQLDGVLLQGKGHDGEIVLIRSRIQGLQEKMADELNEDIDIKDGVPITAQIAQIPDAVRENIDTANLHTIDMDDDPVGDSPQMMRTASLHEDAIASDPRNGDVDDDPLGVGVVDDDQMATIRAMSADVDVTGSDLGSEFSQSLLDDSAPLPPAWSDDADTTPLIDHDAVLDDDFDPTAP